MSKRNAVSYVKPEEPSFLRKIKQQIGYKEGPTVDTKRAALDPALNEDLEDGEDEKPTVVVLKPGDLTEEEANSITQQLQKEEEETPADLTKPIQFKVPSSSSKSISKENTEVEDSKESKGKKRSSISKDDLKAKKSKGSKNKKVLLSFDADEEEDI